MIARSGGTIVWSNATVTMNLDQRGGVLGVLQKTRAIGRPNRRIYAAAEPKTGFPASTLFGSWHR